MGDTDAEASVGHLSSKGYFLIKRDHNGQDVFCHTNDRDDNVAFDDSLFQRRLRFEVAAGRDGKKPRAINAGAADS